MRIEIFDFCGVARFSLMFCDNELFLFSSWPQVDWRTMCLFFCNKWDYFLVFSPHLFCKQFCHTSMHWNFSFSESSLAPSSKIPKTNTNSLTQIQQQIPSWSLPCLTIKFPYSLKISLPTVKKNGLWNGGVLLSHPPNYWLCMMKNRRNWVIPCVNEEESILLLHLAPMWQMIQGREWPYTVNWEGIKAWLIGVGKET